MEVRTSTIFQKAFKRRNILFSAQQDFLWPFGPKTINRGLWSVTRVKCRPCKNRWNFLTAYIIASLSFSICEYCFSDVDSDFNANAIGLLLPSGIIWCRAAPTPVLDASHSKTSGRAELYCTNVELDVIAACNVLLIDLID